MEIKLILIGRIPYDLAPPSRQSVRPLRQSVRRLRHGDVCIIRERLSVLWRKYRFKHLGHLGAPQREARVFPASGCFLQVHQHLEGLDWRESESQVMFES